MKTLRKKTLGLLAGIFALSLAAFGLSASSAYAEDAADWRGAETAQSGSESYLKNQHNLGFDKGFDLSPDGTFIEVSADNNAEGDWRYEMQIANNPCYGSVIGNSVGDAKNSSGISFSVWSGDFALYQWGKGQNGFNPLRGASALFTDAAHTEGLAWSAGTKYRIGVQQFESEYWLVVNGDRIYDASGANVLKNAAVGTSMDWLMTPGSKVYFGFGCAPAGGFVPQWKIYSVTSGSAKTGAVELSKLSVAKNSGAGDGFDTTALDNEYVRFDAPTGLNLPLDTTKEISVTVQGDIAWANFAFTSEPSNGGFADSGAKGTGFSLMTYGYAGLKLNFMNMSDGIQVPEVGAYHSSQAPDHPNSDGVQVADGGKFTFTIKPVSGGFEFWLEGKKMTAFGTEGQSYYDSIKDKIGKFSNEDGKTFLNVSTDGGKSGRIYRVVNGGKIYGVSELAESGFTSLPKEIAAAQFIQSAGSGAYLNPLSAVGSEAQFSVPNFAGTMKLGFAKNASDALSDSCAISLSWENGKLTAAGSGGTKKTFEYAAGNLLSLTTDGSKLYLNGTEVGACDYSASADAAGNTYFRFEDNTTEHFQFYSVKSTAASTYTAALTFKIGTVSVTDVTVTLKQGNETVETVLKNGAFTADNLIGEYEVNVTGGDYEFEAATVSKDTPSKEINGTYSAYVTVKADGKLVEDAAVEYMGAGFGTAVYVGEGVYKFSGLTGIYEVLVKKDGFTFAQATISERSNRTTVLGTSASAPVVPPAEDEGEETGNGCNSSGAAASAGLTLIALAAAVLGKRRIG